MTSYGALLRLDWIGKTRWRLVVIDEAQAIKNPDAKQTRAVKALEADAASRSPARRSRTILRDLWSIFDFLNPGLLGSSKAFAELRQDASPAQTPPSYAPLRKLVAPYILRRHEDRPQRDRRPSRQDGGQGLLRRSAANRRRSIRRRSRRSSERLEESSDDMGRRGLVLATLMRLKQICNHAAHGLGGGGLGRARTAASSRGSPRSPRRSPAARKNCWSSPSSPRSSRRSATSSPSVFGRPGLALSGDTAVGKRKDAGEDVPGGRDASRSSCCR